MTPDKPVRPTDVLKFFLGVFFVLILVWSFATLMFSFGVMKVAS